MLIPTPILISAPTPMYLRTTPLRYCGHSDKSSEYALAHTTRSEFSRDLGDKLAVRLAEGVGSLSLYIYISLSFSISLSLSLFRSLSISSSLSLSLSILLSLSQRGWDSLVRALSFALPLSLSRSLSNELTSLSLSRK